MQTLQIIADVIMSLGLAFCIFMLPRTIKEIYTLFVETFKEDE